jgi:DNA-binding LacI/PurR family transcriptional regulator
MTTPNRPAVMADVARRAGVSIMTVSRVLNEHQRVAPATRERVQQAVQELGYQPNHAARMLAGARSRVLGVVSVQPESWEPSRSVFSVEAAAQRAGHSVSFRTVRDPSTDGVGEAIESLRSLHADGIILIARVYRAVEALKEIAPDIPVVVTYPSMGLSNGVGIDQELGARLATRHLVQLGHDHVIHVRGPHGWIDAGQRAGGWRAELRSSRKTGRSIVGDWTPHSGYEAGRLIARDAGATAVFVANDQMALGVLLALQEAGRRVPEDISVVGFDDTPESAFYMPPLTTVRQDFAELGRLTIRTMLDAIEGVDIPEIIIPPTLIVRKSSAPPT